MSKRAPTQTRRELKAAATAPETDLAPESALILAYVRYQTSRHNRGTCQSELAAILAYADLLAEVNDDEAIDLLHVDAVRQIEDIRALKRGESIPS